MRRAAEVREMEMVVETEMVFAARRGERVVAITLVRLKINRIKSLFHKGQF